MTYTLLRVLGPCPPTAPIRPRSISLRHLARLPRARSISDRKSSNSATRDDEAHAHPPQDINSGNTYTQPAENLSQSVTQAEQQDYDQRIAASSKQKQIRTPWQREGSSLPPVSRSRSAGAMTKGKLLTTPSRMLKMVLPLTTRDFNSDRRDVEPLALLVHPQQPLSYLERLIQSELPTMKDKDGKEKIPSVWFRAEDSMKDQGATTGGEDGVENAKDAAARKGDEKSDGKSEKEKGRESQEEEEEEDDDIENPDTTMIGGETAKTGKINPQSTKQRHSPKRSAALRGGPGEGGVESYSGLGQDAKPSSPPSSSSSSSKKDDSSDTPATDSDRASTFVRWSSSTEIGDFIRDAARARFFAVEIEGAPHPILVGAPSFRDRTYYLRMRLRQRSREIAQLADVKRECDEIAERGAKRVAMAGGGALVGYWWIVYMATFQSDLGWDVMEPVTVSFRLV